MTGSRSTIRGDTELPASPAGDRYRGWRLSSGEERMTDGFDGFEEMAESYEEWAPDHPRLSFDGPCSCTHDMFDHGVEHCDVEGCDCQAQLHASED
jgi:hypothetical protein